MIMLGQLDDSPQPDRGLSTDRGLHTLVPCLHQGPVRSILPRGVLQSWAVKVEEGGFVIPLGCPDRTGVYRLQTWAIRSV